MTEWVNHSLKEDMKTYMETKDNVKTQRSTILGDAAQVALKGNFSATQAYLKKQENLKSTPKPST